VRELSGVFAGHGIGVDPRHLNLIADFMTRNGGFTPFNRMGLTGNVSPFTKMSYGKFYMIFLNRNKITTT